MCCIDFDANRAPHSFSRVSERDNPDAATVTVPPAPRPYEEPKDLGFGSVVGGARQQRLLRRDGSFTARRTGFPRFTYVNGYHALLTMTWPRFLASVLGVYAAINALFAAAYLACGARSLAGLDSAQMGGRFLRAFFFSVDTFATIGYGNVYPVGALANSLVALEAVLGLLFVALLTGLVFARFSRPTARLLFSEVAVIAPYLGNSAFMFRITNARSNQLMELEAKVLFSRLDGSVRRYDQLRLERTRVVFFPLSWTVVHPIDDGSPLARETPETIHAAAGEFLVLLSATDEGFAAVVHARHSYAAAEVEWGRRFGNMFTVDPNDVTAALSVDLGELHRTEPI